MVQNPRAYTSFRKQWSADNWSWIEDSLGGFYFCRGQEISAETIKYGPFRQALQKCDKILTPKVCEGNSTTQIYQLAVNLSHQVANFSNYLGWSHRWVQKSLHFCKINRSAGNVIVLSR